MDIETQELLRKNLLSYLDNRTTDYAPTTMRIPTATYTDPDYLKLEFDQVIRRHPVVVGHHSEVGVEAGSFIRVEAAGLELLVVRQDDGSVKALGNTCRHRGAQVEAAPCGRRRSFSCPYHRWTYHRDGGLRSVPFDDGFVDLDRTEFGLLEYPAAIYAGLIWVLPQQRGGALDMAAYVGPELAAEIEASDVDRCVLYRKETFELDFNWKAAMDGFTDAYHLQFVHPETVGPFFHTNIYQCDIFGKHRRMVVARRGIEDLRDADLADGEFPKYAINGWQVYPGTVIARPPAHWEVSVMIPNPQDLTRSKAILMMLVNELPTSEKATRFRDRNWEMMVDAVVKEDWVVAGSIDPSLRRSDLTELVVGCNEKATQHFHRTLAEDVAAPPLD